VVKGLKLDRPILNYIKILAALQDARADRLMMEQLLAIRNRRAHFITLNLILGALAVSGSAVYLAILRFGGDIPTLASLGLCGLGLLIGASGLCWAGIANYRWATRMHRQIAAALAEEAALLERIAIPVH
jgi:hypothetical protein